MFYSVADAIGKLLSGAGILVSGLLIVFGVIHLDATLICVYLIAIGAGIVAVAHKH